MPAVVSKGVLKGDVISVAIVVQEPPPAGRRWKATDARPEPPVSPADVVSVTVPRRFAPGSSCALVGASVSDLTSLLELAALQLPASSATRKRYCAHLPDATVSGLVTAVQPPYDEQVSFARSPVCRSSVALDASTSASGPESVVTGTEPKA